MSTDNRPIGVLDSGLGGISVLRELVKLMPGEDFIYYGDSANAPYGTRTPEEVIDLTKKDVEFLLERGAKAIVVACNTATSVAIKELRAAYEEVLPVIGIEPALKPAVKAKEHSKVVVMATPMTLSQTKFNSMMHIYEDDANIIKMPCPGLVEYIESEGLFHDSVTDEIASRYLSSLKEKYIDTLVMGCTHYPLIREVIQKHLPGVSVYDGGFGTAKQTKRRLAERGLLSDRESGGKVEIFNSRNTEEILELSRRLLKM